MANQTGGSIGTGNLNMLKLRIYVMAEPHTRNDNMSTVVYDKTNDAIKSIFFPPKLRETFEKGAFLMVHASNVGAESIRISENSRVFQIASFELDDGGKVHNYLNPPEKTVEETLQTPVKTHISVKGILRKSSDLIESPNSRRKELILESMEGTSKIVCKLWGNCALFDVPPQDSIITLTGMDVTSWRGEISLNSSVLTELKETDEDGTFEGEIEAVNFSENYSYVIVNNRTFKMPTKTAIQIFGGKKFKDSITIKGMSKGTTITHVEVCNPAKKQKKD